MIKLEDTGERLIPELHKQSLAYGEHLARYQAAQGLIKDKVVLDIASGAGYGAAFLAQTAKQVIGVDYSEDAIAYSKDLYRSSNLEFKVGDAQSLPLDDSSVDVVVSLETIEHIPKPELFVQEVVRVLKPDGIFYVSTPNDDEFIEGNEFHLHEFDFPELNRLIKKYFKQAEYYYQGTWYASGILNKSGFEEPFTSATTAKTFSQPTNKAIYYLAVATNSPENILSLNQNIVVSDRYSELEAQKQHKAHLQEDLGREDKIKKLEEENMDLSKKVHSLDAELAKILGSKGWKALDKVYKIKSKLPTTKKNKN